MQNLLDVELKDKNNVVIWHDVISNSISKDKSNGFRSLSVPELMAIPNQLENKFRLLVYCQRNRTLNFSQELEKQSFTVLHVEKDFVPYPKQKESFYETIHCITPVPSLNWII